MHRHMHEQKDDGKLLEEPTIDKRTSEKIHTAQIEARSYLFYKDVLFELLQTLKYTRWSQLYPGGLLCLSDMSVLPRFIVIFGLRI